MANVFVGDVGTVIRLDTDETISTATVLRIYYKKPRNNGTGFWAGSLYSTDTVEYTTVEDDIDTAGTWELQAYVEMPDWLGRGTVVEMEVKPTI